MKVTLLRKLPVATDICMFELGPADGAALPPFTAGAHIDVHLGGLVRQYSLCNSPSEAGVYRLGVLRERESRGGSVAMHACEPGTTLEIGEPRNHFPLDPHAAHSVLLAGGIGITPLLSMALHLAESGRSFELHYCAREPARAAFVDRLDTPPLNACTRLWFDDAPAGQRIDFAQVLGKPDAHTHLYVCGPAGFIAAVLGAAAQAGWDPANVHREYFGAAGVGAAGLGAAGLGAAGVGATGAGAAGESETSTAATADGPFQVSLAQSGRVVDVPAGTTIVEALRGCGIEVPVSCEQGVCGTCLTRVLSGTPDHRDVYLTDDERAANDQMLPCCSRARTPMLVLDL
ncbi:PDR/VanB family oxidoreductase [Burkholderia multivorans]|uniref:Oxidoreductase n=1 Tax=Burkholderia multivorans TaxID=87883 RepID=A0A2S9MDS6_9BURK|nr:PDR/VanB family oxidoreductase [Burkholderia multivorans]MBR7894827.1 oxidoreductase [Burkholderia multivorans]MBU9511348.1 PDR/VanB family oxidoreductase [Burkholderia multivorans]MBU9523088.1 PDR/VanB family oxidoreductase [Burkholderia multivorans]MBU9536306.1 PDR/VanB family oxidoreductase [Burkholderia multivorans]MBU9634762.1 PDR/VanB family oxidoreductase [Burkholderia multivorans]